MQLKKLRKRIAQLSTLAAVGIVGLAPLFGTSAPAQAAPPDHAPAWGYRAKGKDNKGKGKKDKHGKRHVEGRDDDWDDDRDDDDWRNDDGEFRSINFSGTVVSLSSRYRLTVRGDNGRTYDVSSRTRLSTSINRGDRVRVTGSADGRLVRADRIVLVDNGGHNGGQDGQNVSFRGTVVSVNHLANTLRVRGDNGRTYVVRYRNADNFRVGSRVRVVGTADRSTVIATSVTRL